MLSLRARTLYRVGNLSAKRCLVAVQGGGHLATTAPLSQPFLSLRAYNRLADTVEAERLVSYQPAQQATEQQNIHKKQQQNYNGRPRRHQNQKKHQEKTLQSDRDTLAFTDTTLPCRHHLDPQGKKLPTSSWVQITGTLPITSLNDVLSSIEQLLHNQFTSRDGVVDLEAPWNPIRDEDIPLLHMTEDDKDAPYRVQEAHVVLSPFGRPTGWKLKLANPSMVHALRKLKCIQVGWKTVQVKVIHPETGGEKKYATNQVDGYVVDDSMVRFESCPDTMTAEQLRMLMSRFELARSGPTVLPWKKATSDGKSHNMFIVRFLDASWARAAVREKQSMYRDGRRLRLIQFPKQLLGSEKKESKGSAMTYPSFRESPPSSMQMRSFSTMTTAESSKYMLQSKRSFSFYGSFSNSGGGSNNSVRMGPPSYQIYGEETALTVKVIPPEFKQLASGTVVMAPGRRGRILMEWIPREGGRYQWDRPIRFALAPEEAASVFLARLDPQKLLHSQESSGEDGMVASSTTVAAAEIVRRPNPGGNESDFVNESSKMFTGNTPDKVFRSRLMANGTVQLMVDYELEGLGGQEPPNENEARGPLQIDVMVGEYQVLRSVVEYSLPRLTGWSIMLDNAMEQSVQKAIYSNNSSYGQSPHNYQNRGNDTNDNDTPF